MIKQRAMELVAALRSGEYKQGIGWLKTRDNAYCCLGVACDVYGKSNISLAWDRIHERETYAFDGATRSLPSSVRKYFGFKTDNGKFMGDGLRASDGREHKFLTDMNDRGISFIEIAAFIEKHWEEL